jgi:hypothetical protein
VPRVASNACPSWCINTRKITLDKKLLNARSAAAVHGANRRYVPGLAVACAVLSGGVRMLSLLPTMVGVRQGGARPLRVRPSVTHVVCLSAWIHVALRRPHGAIVVVDEVVSVASCMVPQNYDRLRSTTIELALARTHAIFASLLLFFSLTLRICRARVPCACGCMHRVACLVGRIVLHSTLRARAPHTADSVNHVRRRHAKCMLDGASERHACQA